MLYHWVIHPGGYIISLFEMSLACLIIHRLCMSWRQTLYKIYDREYEDRTLYCLQRLCNGLSKICDNVCIKADCGIYRLVVRHLCIGYWEYFSITLRVDVCVAK